MIFTISLIKFSVYKSYHQNQLYLYINRIEGKNNKKSPTTTSHLPTTFTFYGSNGIEDLKVLNTSQFQTFDQSFQNQSFQNEVLEMRERVMDVDSSGVLVEDVVVGDYRFFHDPVVVHTHTIKKILI